MAGFLERHFNFLSKPLSPTEIEAVFDSMGERVAFKQLALYIAKSYVSNALSKCEIKVYNGGQEAHDELYYRLNVSPNPNQSGSQFVNCLVDHMLHSGEGLVVPHRKRFLYAADSFTVERQPLKDHMMRSIVIEGQDYGKDMKASDVYYFRLDSELRQGVGKIIDSLYKDYGLLIGAAIEGFRATRGRKYKLVLDRVKVGDEAFNKTYNDVIKKQLQAFMDNPNAIYPQFEGYDLQEMKHETIGDSGDIIAMRKEIFDTVAQAFKIPNSMMYGNMTNTNDVVNQFLTFAVDPIASMMSDELTRKSFTFEEWKAGSKVVVDTKRINHIDIFNVATGIEKLISSGTFSIDMVLKELGYQPLDTEFSSAHFITKNYSRAEDALDALDIEGGETQ